MMSNTSDDKLSLGELSAVSGGEEGRQHLIFDPLFQDDVERLIGQCQSYAGTAGSKVKQLLLQYD